MKLRLPAVSVYSRRARRGCPADVQVGAEHAGHQGIAACAISALDIALWDLKARLLEVPLTGFLGAARRRVPVYGSGGFTTYDDTHMAAQLGGWVHGQQIPRVKIKIGESWGREVPRDLARVRAARQVIGARAELYVDANGAYTRKQAVRVGGVLAELGMGWFEEPVPSDDLTGLRLVRDAVDPTGGTVTPVTGTGHGLTPRVEEAREFRVA